MEVAGLGGYVTPAGQVRADSMANKLCDGANGSLPVEQGVGYYSVASAYYGISATSSDVTTAEPETSTDAETTIIKIVVNIIVKYLEPTIKVAGNRLGSEITPERLREQLEQWLTTPKDSMCRGDLTHGDIGRVIGQIVGCN